jgi:hypothetical protein
MAKYSIFERYVAAYWDDVKAGKEITCELLDLDQGYTKIVKARIARTKKELPDGDELMLKSEDGEWKLGEPWAVKIVEELDPDETVLPPLPAMAKPIYGGG